MECKSLRESGNELKKFKVAYFAASCDDAATNKKFAKSLELDYPILSDPSHEVAKSYGMLSGTNKYPARKTIVIDKNGKVIAIIDKVSVKTHGKDLVAKLKELGIEQAE